MDEGGLFVFHLLGVFATLSEVRVLVDGAGDQTGYGGCLFRIRAEDVREAGGEGAGGLGGAEEEFADVVTVTWSQHFTRRLEVACNLIVLRSG